MTSLPWEERLRVTLQSILIFIFLFNSLHCIIKKSKITKKVSVQIKIPVCFEVLTEGTQDNTVT